MIYPSAALLWEAQMLCWLASGEHEALNRDKKRARILIPTEGKLTIPLQIYPTASREIALSAPPMGGPDALLASIWRT